MNLPVFVSCPSLLTKDQEVIRDRFENLLRSFDLEPVTLGRNHKSISGKAPLAEIMHLARHCCGGVVLGFAEFKSESTRAVVKSGDPDHTRDMGSLALSSAWNQLEAGILLGLERPVMVCREKGVMPSGILDPQVGDRYVVEFDGASDEIDDSPVLAFRSDVVSVYTGRYPS